MRKVPCSGTKWVSLFWFPASVWWTNMKTTVLGVSTSTTNSLEYGGRGTIFSKILWSTCDLSISPHKRNERTWIFHSFSSPAGLLAPNIKQSAGRRIFVINSCMLWVCTCVYLEKAALSMSLPSGQLLLAPLFGRSL